MDLTHNSSILSLISSLYIRHIQSEFGWEDGRGDR